MTASLHDRISGALLGFLSCDHQALQWPEGLTPLGATALAVTEVVARDEYPNHGEIARAIIDHAEDDPRYSRELGPLFGMWNSGMPTPEAAAQASASFGLESDFPAAVHLLGGLLHPGDPVAAAAYARDRARLTHIALVSVDAAGVAAAAVAAALTDDDVSAAARAAAQTSQMRDRLVPAEASAPPGRPEGAMSALAVDRSAAVAEIVARAIASAADGDTAGEATGVTGAGGDDALAAMTGALMGARFGATAAADALSSSVLRRVTELAARMAST